MINFIKNLFKKNRGYVAPKTRIRVETDMYGDVRYTGEYYRKLSNYWFEIASAINMKSEDACKAQIDKWLEQDYNEWVKDNSVEYRKYP